MRLRDEKENIDKEYIIDTFDLIERTLAVLRHQTGLTARVRKGQRVGYRGRRPDAEVEIDVGDQKLRFIVVVERIDRFERVAQIRAHWPIAQAAARPAPHETIPPAIVVAPYITAEMADQFRNLRVFFLDAAGNAYIDMPGLFLFITGRKRPADLFPAERGRLTKPAALKIEFAVLCRPELLLGTYRKIAEAARVALGTIGPVIKELEARRHIAEFGTVAPKRKILNPEGLVKEWVNLYHAILRPKLNARRFRAPNMEWTDTADLQQHGAYWGGEVAAKRITGYLQPETATIYVTHPPTPLIVEHRLRADVNGNVEFLNVFWNPDKIPHEPNLVPPILAYADLLATTEGRNLEAAKLIYDEHITPNLRRTA